MSRGEGAAVAPEAPGAVRGGRPDLQRPRANPALQPRPAPQRGPRRPAAFPEGPIRSRGLAWGRRDRGPVGHPDSGLDLVGWLLWQPGGRGKREGTRGAGTPSAVARGGGWLGLTQTGPLLEPGWEQLHGRKRADTAPTNIRLVPSRSSTSARVSLSLGDGDPVILPTEKGFPANHCDSSSGK
ncbi:bcl-2-binding component 3, isoforms 3/4-like [Papio anubis]|uniref:bcl-2-binding component 3, isoforms 3/4-like n=1 Tax=Papio anubis TaxID=9555 RepID=UPI00083F33E3|nr:bcl-2-binding component 3, isoforms 3/4-like [Papio anubis]